eukprot:TRINITY_DN42242_c3_g1_i4.p3 TRINITY_DN42242_c3_g1~~TRINITY_DN42242_c3_g1_i4.p3  ORF type:complete len:109 (-),score=3.99 TRINITY_DN42242_c3_g1_i4:46-372(-)
MNTCHSLKANQDALQRRQPEKITRYYCQNWDYQFVQFSPSSGSSSLGGSALSYGGPKILNITGKNIKPCKAPTTTNIMYTRKEQSAKICVEAKARTSTPINLKIINFR